MFAKKSLSIILMLCMLLSAAFIPTISAAQIDTQEVSASADIVETGANYGLAKNIQDGNILHCFNWKYNDIKAELPNIAAAGFTSVQTSPAQPAGGGEWYWLYQPYGFYVGTNSLGSKGDLQSLCQEAEKYGIKVIVDVVANHLNGETHRVQSDLQDGQYWHNHGGVSNWCDRYQVTHGEIGMRDLNSEHNYVQQVVGKYMKELEAIGVDGIRWDAAKHIGLPSESCSFWPAVTSNNSMWHYGEILVGPDDRGSGNEGLMKEYTNYMSVTDSIYGMDLRNSFAGGNVPQSIGNWSQRGVAANKLVYWGESHDTWSNGNDWGFSHGMSQNVIDRAYAVVASRNGSNALYFSRPGTADKSGIHSGQKGSTAFKSPEITAVNKLKNACVGEKDYYVTANNCAAVCRESGAVIVAGSGGGFSVNVPNGGGTTKPGTYKDLVTGSTWTVTSSTISGQIGSSGIAVLLDAKPAGPSASVTPGSQGYMTDSLTLTLNVENAASGQYSIDGGAYQNFSNGQKITIGAGKNFGTKTTVTVKVANGDSETYTYTKVDASAVGIYFNNSSTNWNKVYCYIYKDGNNAPSQWPGIEMKSIGNNVWYLDVPAGFENCNVLFTDNSGNQLPSSNEPGFEYKGTAMMYKNSSWQPSEYYNNNNNNNNNNTIPTVPSKPTEPDYDTPGVYVIMGDVDESGYVNIKDATIVQKAVTELETLSEKAMFAANVDFSNAVNVKDATILQKYVASIPTDYKVGEKMLYSGNADIPETPTAPDTPVVPEIPEKDDNTTDLTALGSKVVVFKGTGYSSPYAYSWSSNGQTTMSWPGEAMKKLGDFYYAVIPAGADKIIFSNNGSNQSGDLSIPADYAMYDGSSWSTISNAQSFPVSGGNNNNNNNNVNVSNEYIYVKDNANWGNVYCHSWGADGAGTNWPGTQMEAVGGGLFRIKLDSNHTNVVFNNGNGAQTSDLQVKLGQAYNNQSGQWENVN